MAKSPSDDRSATGRSVIQHHTVDLKASPILHAFYRPLCVNLMILMFLTAICVCVYIKQDGGRIMIESNWTELDAVHLYVALVYKR